MYMIESEENWPGLAKVIEETSELNVNLAKLMANNGNTNYWGDVNLWGEMADELADSIAAITYFIEESGFDRGYIERRAQMKLNRFYKWKANPDLRDAPQEEHYV